MNARDTKPSMMNAVEPHDLQSWEDVSLSLNIKERVITWK